MPPLGCRNLRSSTKLRSMAAITRLGSLASSDDSNSFRLRNFSQPTSPLQPTSRKCFLEIDKPEVLMIVIVAVSADRSAYLLFPSISSYFETPSRNLNPGSHQDMSFLLVLPHLVRRLPWAPNHDRHDVHPTIMIVQATRSMPWRASSAAWRPKPCSRPPWRSRPSRNTPSRTSKHNLRDADRSQRNGFTVPSADPESERNAERATKAEMDRWGDWGCDDVIFCNDVTKGNTTSRKCREEYAFSRMTILSSNQLVRVALKSWTISFVTSRSRRHHQVVLIINMLSSLMSFRAAMLDWCAAVHLYCTNQHILSDYVGPLAVSTDWNTKWISLGQWRVNASEMGAKRSPQRRYFSRSCFVTTAQTSRRIIRVKLSTSMSMACLPHIDALRCTTWSSWAENVVATTSEETAKLVKQ